MNPFKRKRASPTCKHFRIVAVDTLGTLEDPDRVAFLCLDCDAALPHDFASPAH